MVCTKSYGGYSGKLYDVLYESSTLTYRPEIADGFRRWTTLCTVNNPPVGDYLLQVQSNVGGAPDSANGGNRFAVRATASNINALSIAGRENMGIFSNLPGGVTEFISPGCRAAPPEGSSTSDSSTWGTPTPRAGSPWSPPEEGRTQGVRAAASPQAP